MNKYDFSGVQLEVFKQALSSWLSSGKQGEIQASKMAVRAIESIETAFKQEPENLEGFRFNRRSYELIYRRKLNDFEMVVSFYGCGKIVYYIVTGAVWRRGKGSKKTMKEVTKDKAIEEMTMFFLDLTDKA